ncbi:hypothetical protein HZB08_03205, partial [Candidatus Saganbacteria bacterium]|nr:hypothetical protein [Candidatus Saganbacteria bacterium]
MSNLIITSNIPNVFPVSQMVKGRTPFKKENGLPVGEGKIQTLMGNHCIGYAVSQAMKANCGGGCVTSAYPITPATEILHYLRALEADGKIPSLGFNASSEHEAMTAAIAASFGGARSFIATSSVGFMHMMEMVESAGQNRIPVVMALSNRANAPLNIWNADDDRIRARDFAIQLVAENHQQAYDLTLQAFRIAETAYWLTIINQAGFFISHSVDKVRTLPDDRVLPFVGQFTPAIDPFKESISKGGLTSPRAFALQRAQNFEAWGKVKDIVKNVHDEYGKISGRAPGAFFNTYYLEDAKYVFFNYGFLSGTLRTFIDILRRDGVPVGLISGTLFRPFPDRELAGAIFTQAPKAKIIGVFDGSLDPTPGVNYTDLSSALYTYGRNFHGPLLINFKYGGGQNPSLSVLNGALQRMMDAAKRNTVEYPIQQLDRNSEGANISLDLSKSAGKEVVEGQSLIEFLGRGGLGAVSAAGNLVYITNEKGELIARGIPQFGSEKTGSPTFATAVMDKQPITSFYNEG